MIVNDVQSVRFTRRLGKDRKKRTERKIGTNRENRKDAEN